jgi:5'-deoxynucleotidase YfbR-like HD superfamily hydrolase
MHDMELRISHVCTHTVPRLRAALYRSQLPIFVRQVVLTSQGDPVDVNGSLINAYNAIAKLVDLPQLPEPEPVVFAQVDTQNHSGIPPVVQLYSGAMFNLLEPDCSEINIEDIAHSLSNQCRFNGHTKRFYSVAQHSVLVSYLVEPSQALAALMHDAAEAYYGDIPTPLKRLLPIIEQKEAETLELIFNLIGLPYPLTPEIHHADKQMLAAEVNQLLNPAHEPEHWQCIAHITPPTTKIIPWAPKLAEKFFLDRFYQLQAQLNAA